MNIKTISAFVIVIVVLGGAAYFIGRSPDAGPPTPPIPPTPPGVKINNNWKMLLSQAAGPPLGNPNAPWVMIECGDFECPNCGKAKPVVEKFINDSHGQIKLYFVNYPLERIHKHAIDAAEASLAAGAQGKFWPMYDMLYGDQDALVPSEIEYHAANIPGLDTKKFTKDMESHKYDIAARKSEAAVMATGIMSTPTFLVRSAKGGKVQAYVGLEHVKNAPKLKNLVDLIASPPWNAKPATATVAAKPAGPASTP